MIRTLQRTAAIIFALCLPLFAQGLLPASADGEDPRLEISADRLAPGTILHVRGVNLAREENIPISLVGVAGEFTLGVITSDESGEFTQSFVLPADLPEGTYRVLARIPGAVGVVSAPLKVQGLAVFDVEESGQREQEELLLAPIPTSPRASAATATSLPGTASSPVESPSWYGALGLIAFAVVLLVTMKVWRRRREPASP